MLHIYPSFLFKYQDTFWKEEMNYSHLKRKEIDIDILSCCD